MRSLSQAIAEALKSTNFESLNADYPKEKMEIVKDFW